jgi:signal transduction histidine kinase
MTVKKRISLLIIAAGLITSLLFSVFVFIELVDESFKILDKVLKDEAYSTTRMFLKLKKESNIETFDSDFIPDYYFWLKITEQDSNTILYQSNMAKLINLSSVKPGGKSIETFKISRKILNLHQDSSQEVTLRIKTYLISEDGKNYVVQIARSIKKLKSEIREIVVGLLSGLLLSGLFLTLISRFIAGKILKPIGVMKDLTQDISEKDLSRRIPTRPEQDEFNELARTINKMLDRLQGSFIKQRTFLFDTSHELKTPLTTIRLAIDNICTSDNKNLPVSITETLFELNSQVLRMERLVKDLLNLSSLETLTGIDLKPVNLTGILSSLVNDYNVIADSQNVQMDIQTSDELILQGDSDKLTRMFSNLLDNAIKYNVEKGRIKVISSKSGNGLTIKIGNTGNGVAETEIGKVFDQFYRVEKSRSIQNGGYGLGLAIVKRIVELHNGKITFESKPGVWTEVTIFFPLQ